MTMTWNEVSDLYDAAVLPFEELRGQLCALHDRSYLGRRILFHEFWPEIQALQDAAVSEVWAKSGWTHEEFFRVLDLQLSNRWHTPCR